MGHLVDVCYKKHGYPPNFKNNQGSINMVAEEDDDDNNIHSQKEADAKPKFYFTLEQKEALIALLNQQDTQPRHSINQLTTTNLPSHKGISYIMSLSIFSPKS
ncbi:hypothetical protein PIB30_075308 [Stylosanthes scabra]|uniref:Uncharacterized protein n=1 Tax=Stylosanthes scabra TaxID=79078 RepID=A0ABU6VQW2_9FABA|nr:hypothetical protein [Stylosanthes scabra]